MLLLGLLFGCVYAVGFIFTCLLTLLSFGFPNGPTLIQTIWYTVFWPLSVPLFYLRERLRHD